MFFLLCTETMLQCISDIIYLMQVLDRDRTEPYFYDNVVVMKHILPETLETFFLSSIRRCLFHFYCFFQNNGNSGKFSVQ